MHTFLLSLVTNVLREAFEIPTVSLFRRFFCPFPAKMNYLTRSRKATRLRLWFTRSSYARQWWGVWEVFKWPCLQKKKRKKGKRIHTYVDIFPSRSFFPRCMCGNVMMMTCENSSTFQNFPSGIRSVFKYLPCLILNLFRNSLRLLNPSANHKVIPKNRNSPKERHLYSHNMTGSIKAVRHVFHVPATTLSWWMTS